MKLILGHNQFLGISHISEKNASERESRFSDPHRIFEIVQAASEFGFKQMIIESHPRMKQFMDIYEKERTFDMEFILQVPHVSGYVRSMAEGGVNGVVREVISGARFTELAKAPFQLLPMLLRSDYLAMGIKALDIEMSKYSHYDISGVVLHNVITDVLLSLDAKEGFNEYRDRVRRRFGFDPGLITLNLPLLHSHLSEWKVIPNMLITPLNPFGFDMNPSKQAVENCVRESKYDIIGMNVLGGGSINLSAASTYLKNLEGLEGIVIGASTSKHLEELANAFGVVNRPSH